MKTTSIDTESSHDTGIEWTHHPGYRGATWNPLAAIDKESGKRGWFCTHVSEGCRNCYAEKLNVEGAFGKFGTGHEYKHQNLSEIEFEIRNADQPIRWEKPRCAFVNSMTDLHHEEVPRDIIDQTYAAIALSPTHRFLILTKRPEEMRSYITAAGTPARVGKRMLRLIKNEHQINEGWAETRAREVATYDKAWPPQNAWLGVSAEDQSAANDRIPTLLSTPAAVRFVSVEPIIGPVDLTNVETIDSATGEEWHFNALSGSKDDGLYFPGAGIDGEVRALDWIIAGGESGENARAPHPEWFRNLRDQCSRAGVPYFFKQWGAWKPISSLPDPKAEAAQEARSTTVEAPIRKGTKTVSKMYFVGKDRGENKLRGREHRAIPEPEDRPESMSIE